MPVAFSTSDNGRVAIAANWYISPVGYFDALYIVDLTTATPIARIDLQALPGDIVLSKNGRYVRSGNGGWRVWRLGVSGGATYVERFCGGFSFVDGGERFAHAENGTFRLLQADNLQVLAEYAVPDDLTLYNHDPISGYIAATSYEGNGHYTCLVFDAETGEVHYQAPIKGPPWSTTVDFSAPLGTSSPCPRLRQAPPPPTEGSPVQTSRRCGIKKQQTSNLRPRAASLYF